MIFYAKIIQDEDYKNKIYELLIKSFNISYNKFINEYIISSINDNITTYITDKLDIILDRFQKKISLELNYYIYLLNNTKEVGNSTKKAYINLYSNIKDKINDTLYYLIEEDIFFYINIFYRENKKQFLNNFINFYNQETNKYQINTFKLSQFLTEIIYSKDFNKTLKNISTEIIYNITDYCELTLKKILDNKVQYLYNSIDNIQNKIIF